MKLAYRFAIILLVTPAVGGEPSHAPPNEYNLLRSFPPGRLAALCAYDQPDAKGLTGSNRTNGSWLEAGPQRGSCRGVVAAVIAGDLAAADAAWRGIEVAFDHQREDGGFDVSTNHGQRFTARSVFIAGGVGAL